MQVWPHCRNWSAPLIAVGLFLTLPSPVPAGGQSAQIRLLRTVGPPTAIVKVDGRGYAPQEAVAISFDAEPLRTIEADDAGEFRTGVRIPASATPGNHQVSATGEVSGSTASATFTVQANWFQLHFDPAHTGLNPYENVLSPRTVGGLAPKWTAQAQGILQASPVVVAGVVYTAGDAPRGGTELYAIEAETGELLWRRRQDDGNDVEGLGLYKGRVYVATLDDHALHAYDADDGRPLWTFHSLGAVSGPTVAMGRLYVNARDRLYALEPATGAVIWQRNTGGDATAEPVVTGGRVYVPEGTFGKLSAYDALTGGFVWEAQLAGDTDGPPTVDLGLVYVETVGAGLYALDAATGEPVWRATTGGGKSTAAVAGGVVYVGDDYGKLFAFDAKTGERAWQASTPRGFGLASPVVANGVVYSGTLGIYAFDARTGDLLWSADSGIVNSSPVVVDGILYVGDFDYKLHAFSLPDQTPDQSTQAPAASS